MRRAVMPSVHQEEQVGQTAIQPLNLPLVPAKQERVTVERNETAIVAATLERTKTNRTLALVTEPQVVHVPAIEATHISILMPKPVSATTSQEIPATPTIVKTLLLLTSRPKFDRTTT